MNKITLKPDLSIDSGHAQVTYLQPICSRDRQSTLDSL